MHVNGHIRRVMIALAAIAIAGCKKDSTGPSLTEPGGSTPVTLKGILTAGTLSGDINVTVTNSTVSGCVYFKTAACGTATGTYTVASKFLSFTTSSPSLTFTGTYANGVVEGAIAGSQSGVFVVRNGSAVTAYCGTFSGAASGTWNFTVDGGVLNGAYDDGSGGDYLTGTVNGSTLSISFAAGTASGTISATTASGTWNAGAGVNGTWTGGTAGCRS